MQMPHFRSKRIGYLFGGNKISLVHDKLKHFDNDIHLAEYKSDRRPRSRQYRDREPGERGLLYGIFGQHANNVTSIERHAFVNRTHRNKPVTIDNLDI